MMKYMVIFCGIIPMLHASEANINTHEPITEERFIEALNDMTEQNHACCLRAIKQDLNCRDFIIVVQEAGASIRLGVIDFCFRQYIGLTDEQRNAEKQRYKDIINALLKAGARPGANFRKQINEIYELGTNLQSWSVWSESSDINLTAAFQAIRDKNFHALDTLLKQHTHLVSLVGVNEKKTLLHEAAEHFSQDDPLSIQIFAYLIRKGADATMPNAEGKSVEAIMNDGHAASALFVFEHACRHQQPISEVSLEKVFQKVKPLYDTLKPYEGYILIGGACVSALWYLFRSKHGTPKQPEAALPLQQLT